MNWIVNGCVREQFAAYLQYLPSVRAYLKETGTHLEDRCLFIEYPLTAYQFNGAKIIHENPFVKSFRENFVFDDGDGVNYGGQGSRQQREVT